MAIPLVRDTIDSKDIDNLIEWLKTYPKLTKGDLTIQLEEKWSKYLKRKYSVFLNSGSSANLAMAYSLLQTNKLRNKKVIVPAVSWVTTVAPFIQLGFEPIMCDTDSDTLGVSISHLENLIQKHNPSILIVVHVLGIPNKMKEIIDLCNKYDVILLEDSCESVGSKYDDKLTGQFGLMSSFSTYFGHHFSVSPDTPIPYIDNNNNFKIDEIKYIYDNYKNKSSDIKIICFDKNNYKTLYKSPNDILEHKFNNKKILRLTLFNNRKVDITEDHSVFSYNKYDFDIIEKKGNDIKIDDYILVPSKIHRPKLKTELNFIEWCKEKNNEYFIINYDKKDLTDIWFKWDSKENKQKDNWRIRKVLPLEYLKNYTDDLKIAKKNTPKNKYLPIKYSITNDLCRLIGYFLSEGSYGDSSLHFSFSIKEKEYINDVKYIIKNIFNLDTYDTINNNGHTLGISSETLKIFFKDFLDIKIGASNKRIPSFIYHCNDEQIISFLYGYFAGDGTTTDTRISVTSVSKKLINDVSYLFNILGLNGSIVETNYENKKDHYIVGKKIKNRKTQYRFILNNVKIIKDGTIELNKKIEHTSPHKKLTFPIYRFSKKNNNYVDYKYDEYNKIFNNELKNNTKLNDFVNNDLMLLKVKKIEEIIPNYDYVYDFSVNENENFIGGWQPICLHNSTIEGGFVSTDDRDLYNILKSIRAHGWDRDLELDYQTKLRSDYNVNEFKALYTFYYPGFNLRSTDLQAYIGLLQLDKLEEMNKKRNKNFLLYHSLIKNDYWKINPTENSYVCNFAYPIIHPNIKEIVKILKDNEIETRPLICGSIAKQPFWENIYGKTNIKFAEIVDDYGLYLPNNHQMTNEEIVFICEKINDIL